MKRIISTLILVITFSLAFPQSKQDIADYLKSRIEIYSERPSTIKLTSCDLSIFNTIAIPGNETYTLEMTCHLEDLLDVFYVNNNQVWITLKFRSKNVSYTDIEQNNSKKTWKRDDEINLFFSKETINDEEAKKIVALIKKLGKLCNASVLEIK